MTELADSIKRLREYGGNMSKDLRIVSPSPIQPLEVHSGKDTVALFAGSSTWNAEAFVAIPEAIQTINQLVDLVAEMHKASMVVWKTNNPQTKEENEPLVELRELVTKAAPIAQLKEK